jgi:hypothetical protein
MNIDTLREYILAARTIGQEDFDIMHTLTPKHVTMIFDYVCFGQQTGIVGTTMPKSAVYCLKAAATVTFPASSHFGFVAGKTYFVNEQKIHTIKLVRELTGLGLKEAKDFVEGCSLNFNSAQAMKLVGAFGDSLLCSSE